MPADLTVQRSFLPVTFSSVPATRRRTEPAAGLAAVRRVLAALGAAPDAPTGAAATGAGPERADLRTACRFLCEELAARAPGHAVEVRIPPYAVVQCVTGPRHTRGTPPNVVEADPVTWVQLAAGRLSWAEAARDGRVRASGERADLSAHLPLLPLHPPPHPLR